ncbi:MAG: amylo-alpha-1,6-glucosidase [Thermoanaerobaculia bacterium]
MTLSAWTRGQDAEKLLTREWLVTNGLGGYASGTIAGINTRRYHGWLIAALASPLGRSVMLNALQETVVLGDGRRLELGGRDDRNGIVTWPDPDFLDEFRLEDGLPVWRFRNESVELEKRVVMPHLQNTTCIGYRVLRSDAPLVIEIRPAIHFRGHEDLVSGPLPDHCELVPEEASWEVRTTGDFPPLRLHLYGENPGDLEVVDESPSVAYRVERRRGYEYEGSLWIPGRYRIEIEPGEEAGIIASTEEWSRIQTLRCSDAVADEVHRRRRLLDLADERAQVRFGPQLLLAADQFITVPETRAAEVSRIEAVGEQPRTIIAGYHWFTDWGRDTMISLEGLALVTGRAREAASILRTFARYVDHGLIPNMFPEGDQRGLYNTADATLWFFHAIDRYVEYTDDRGLLIELLPRLAEILRCHREGTLFGIGVDPEDGLLRQGAEGLQLTWMDAKVGDWVVTPRRGKAVEINALYYNALRLMERWLEEENSPEESRRFGESAARMAETFNRRFWYSDGGYLYDVLDGENGDDPSLRPNQLFAISLPNPVLDPSRWGAVLEVTARELLTPVGLRSLARGEAGYRQQYVGDLRARNEAYHQGTVWAWLIGPFIDAWRREHPDDIAGLRGFLDGFEAHLKEAGIGTISEVFDAEAPYAPRGCIAQAWSVAEVLRALVGIESARRELARARERSHAAGA